jgi:hypothetical protein
MFTARFRALVAALLVMGCAVLTGCGPAAAAPPAAASSTQPFPPRPVALPVTGLDPCTLLSTDEQHTLGVSTATGGYTGDPTCVWSSTGGPPVDSWRFQLNSGYGAAAGLAVAGAVRGTVDGFGAVFTEGLDHGTSCEVWVDVAPGQSLSSLYSNPDGNRRGMSHQQACRLGAQGAELLLSTLARLRNVTLTPSSDPPPPAGVTPPHPPFPARPATRTLDGLDACALLPPAQAAGVGARSVMIAPRAPVNYCRYHDTTPRGGGQWTVRLLTYQSAGVGTAGAAVGTLDGYGTAESGDPQLGPDISCRVAVDVADGQSLEVDYEDDLNDNPAGMNHGVACQRARSVAGAVLGNLRVRGH